MPEMAAIYIIHHSPERADQLVQDLQACTHAPVRAAMLQLTASDYADIAADPETGAVIISQDLDPLKPPRPISYASSSSPFLPYRAV